MEKKIAKKEVRLISQTILLQTLTLCTSALGLVAALAWNEAIKEYVDIFIKPYFAKGSGVISLFVYAIGITVVTVIVTIQLARIQAKIDAKKS